MKKYYLVETTTQPLPLVSSHWVYAINIKDAHRMARVLFGEGVSIKTREATDEEIKYLDPRAVIVA